MPVPRSEEHTSELQSRRDLVCRLLLEKKKQNSSSARACFPSRKRRVPMAASSRACRISDRDCGFARAGRSAAWFLFFFFNDTATTEIYTLSLHDALPI